MSKPLVFQNSNGKEWLIPTTVEEDMRRNDSGDWNIVPTTVAPPKVVQEEVVDEAAQARKRIVCSKMTECLRVIENCSAQISKVSLNSLRDAVTTAHEALDLFVDTTSRISIDRNNPKADGEFRRSPLLDKLISVPSELDELLKPLAETKGHMAALQKSLDNGGWTVSVLSRDSDSSRSMDALEQFIATLHKAPTDCRRLLQWTQLLIPSSTIVFLSPINNVRPELPKAVNTLRVGPERSANLLGSPPFLDETKRLSSSSTSTVTSSDSSQPSSILVTKHSGDKPKGRVTFADERFEVYKEVIDEAQEFSC
ncbi:hypothetical protein OESDEN_04171 [Oesophagostomum dentatum]|uniref:Serine rich protein interaction domain-containing protein n=1 Tax=Oesophagostomum dentatum TaxID=61180 RepID=A0A0B1TKD1_OESDE|nr:hypothetical protein OESDEN_04171 [Oesophagostomum dentatum]